MDRPLAGRVGVVTGASTGIGAATARALAEAGMTVVLAARRTELLAGVCDAIRAAGGQADAVRTDLREPEQVDALIDGAVARHGRLDALVNNAAVGTVRTVAEGRLDEWKTTFDTNVLGTLCACRAALRHMLPAGSGDVLIMGSASAQEAWPYFAAYAASKAALLTVARSLRAEVATAGIRVMTMEIHNVGGTDFASNFDPAVLPVAMKRWMELGLFNRQAPMLTAEAVARAVVFQLSTPQPASIHDLVIRSREN